jgi:hypothetical protein
MGLVREDVMMPASYNCNIPGICRGGMKERRGLTSVEVGKRALLASSVGQEVFVDGSSGIVQHLRDRRCGRGVVIIDVVVIVVFNIIFILLIDRFITPLNSSTHRW